MTTKEIATTTLTKAQATALTNKIKAASNRVVRDAESALNRLEDNLVKLKELIDQAERGEIHKALGCTYSAWLKDTLRIEVSDRPERKVFALMMSDKGMSTRTIADILGVGKSTVDRDLGTAPRGTVDGKVTSVDGKKHPAKKAKATEQEPIDAEVVPLEQEPAPKIPPITEDFSDEVDTLCISVQALIDIFKDDRFPKALNRIRNLKASGLFSDAVNKLELMCDVTDETKELDHPDFIEVVMS